MPDFSVISECSERMVLRLRRILAASAAAGRDSIRADTGLGFVVGMVRPAVLAGGVTKSLNSR
ncbi:MAG: hypothetical protein U5N10_05770 [Gemmobacter sp.]|nr:hypothetical protein [Gemmobacter sp.]